MEIRLHETIRTLRREKNITQEELADFLGISPQAVSKWERGEGMPDITLLPRLSRYFDVSVDTLLGMEDVRVDEKVEEYSREGHRFANLGKTEERVALWEKAYAEYPNHPRVIMELMYALFAKERTENADRVIELGKTLFDHPKADVEHRAAAIQVLTYAYDEKGDKAAAKKYAEMAMSLWGCKESLLGNILEGEEGCKHNQMFLTNLIDKVSLCVNLIHCLGKYPPEKGIRVWRSMIRIFEAVFEDGDYGFYACRMGDLYWKLSCEYAELGEGKSCLDAIEKSTDFTILFDTASASKNTSPLVDLLDHDPCRSAKNYSHNDSYVRLQTLKNKRYDFIRDTERFRAAIKRLEAVAK